MTWVKASERLPEIDGWYFGRNDTKKFIWRYEVKNPYFGIYDEWLDESEAQQGESDR